MEECHPEERSDEGSRFWGPSESRADPSLRSGWQQGQILPCG